MSTFTTRCPICKGLNRVPVDRVSESATCGKCKAALFDGAPIEGTTHNIDQLLASDLPVVIDFWAPWCNPCVGFAPVFEQVAAQRKGTVRFVKVDTEAQQMLGARYQIRSIPTLMLFNGGKRIDMMSGALPKSDFERWLDERLI